jgi:hypothetical protein
MFYLINWVIVGSFHLLHLMFDIYVLYLTDVAIVGSFHLLHLMFDDYVLYLTDVVIVGSFHLLHLMFDDYVLYLVENLYSQERSADFLRHIKGELTGVYQRFPPRGRS